MVTREFGMNRIYPWRARILVIDNSEINREMLKDILGEVYEIRLAGSGREALEILEEEHWNLELVILKLEMPDIDGYKLLEIMGEKKWLDEFAVIAVIASLTADIKRAYELGACDCFRLPYATSILSHRIENAIATHEKEYRDYLTGSYNRRGFIYMAEKFLNHCDDRSRYGILYFNIKSFKATNELLGVKEGDRILRSFCERINQSFLHPVYTARIEADHFVSLVECDRISPDRLSEFCGQILEVNNKKIRIRCRCGIFYLKNENMSVSGMVDRAKLAKQYIVDEYLKPYAIFDHDMDRVYIDNAEITAEFEDAITNEELEVYYQPIVDSVTGRIISAEALIRWNHSKKGFISPGVFVSKLEEDGSISKLDRYVFRKVRAYIGDRYTRGLKIVPVSMNLSWMDFYDEELIGEISDFLEKSEFPSKFIRFEITETSYAALEENVGKILSKVKDKGARILLDDFGSGYSSFNMLQRFFFDILKIDMSFTKEIEMNSRTRKLIPLIIEAAHALDAKTIAEGAETKEQVEFLREHGCDYIQGYYFHRPLKKDEFSEKLDQNS